MKETFYVKSCQYLAGTKVTLYLGNLENRHWTPDITEAQDFATYPAAQAAVAEVIKPGDRLQVEKYFVA